MSKLLIIQSGDANVARYLDRSEPFHEEYARRCGADFWRFDGCWKQSPHPAWNRLPMMLDAFERGYERVLWLDSDTLVVDPWVNVFDEAPWSHEHRRVVGAGESDGPPWEYTPFVMRRTAGGFHWPMDGIDEYEGWNDGVLLVSYSAESITALSSLWDCRSRRPRPHHQPTLWELNWLLDWVKSNPSYVVEMDQRFNWQPFNGSSPEQYAVIKAWHGLPHEQRWAEFSATVDALVYEDTP